MSGLGMHRRSIVSGMAAFAAVTAVQRYAEAQSPDIVVFAAASLKNVLDVVAEGFQRNTGKRVTVSYAASSALAVQIATVCAGRSVHFGRSGMDGLPGAAQSD
jgi:ABC-type molybdate transport system substrate-binding protein